MNLIITKIVSITTKKGDPLKVVHYINPQTAEVGTFFAPADFSAEVVETSSLIGQLESLPTNEVIFDNRGRVVS